MSGSRGRLDRACCREIRDKKEGILITTPSRVCACTGVEGAEPAPSQFAIGIREHNDRIGAALGEEACQCFNQPS